MDIDNHVNGIVQGIIDQVVSQVQIQAVAAINQRINTIVEQLDSETLLAELLNKKIEERLSRLPIDTKNLELQMATKLDSVAQTITATVQENAVKQSVNQINAQINKIDFAQLCQATLLTAFKNQQLEFPAGSIPGAAINPTGWVLSGSNVKGGLFENFSSTGIDDRALTCQLSIFDHTTVVENNLVTKDLTVKGTTTIEGDLNVTGTLPETSPLFVSIVNAATNNVRSSLDGSIFGGYSDMVFNKIREQGLDLSNIKLNGQTIIDGQSLAFNITTSNLQRVGELRELQVQGETFLSGTLYTTGKRVGINTIEPANTLSIWDQEIEIGVGKRAVNVAAIETPRNQELILSSNRQDNITLRGDGTTAVKKLELGGISISVAGSPPADDQPRGTIVFNSNPNLGGPLGWVSLGNANWANFGIID